LKHVGQNLALLVQEFIMISFLPWRPFLPLRETSFVLRIYLPNRRQGKQEEEKEEFLFRDNFVRVLRIEEEIERFLIVFIFLNLCNLQCRVVYLILSRYLNQNRI
jgi:hypothetical protein